jgi:enamine deaminase RidA (YjgF/YER057c/UK114 family)
MPIKRIRADDILPEPISHYTDAIQFGDMVWLAGLVGCDKNGKLAEGGAQAQARQLFKNMGALLKKFGADASNIVKVTVYLRNAEDREAVNVARKEFFGPHRPVSTLVVARLAKPDILVEIEAVAYVGK